MVSGAIEPQNCRLFDTNGAYCMNRGQDILLNKHRILLHCGGLMICFMRVGLRSIP